MNSLVDDDIFSLPEEKMMAKIIERYTSAIYNFIAQFIGYGSDAEDVTQEVFIKVWKHIDNFDRTKKFSSWLFRIAKNAAIDFIRVRKPALSVEEYEDVHEEGWLLPDNSPLPVEMVATLDDVQFVREVLGKLSPLYRAVLQLYYMEEYSFAEIGEIMSEPIDTVKSRHRRALIVIRKMLDADPVLARRAPK